MGSVHETVKTVNNTLRTLLAMVVVGAAGYGGYVGYALYHEPQQLLDAKQAELDEVRQNLTETQAGLAAKEQQVVELSARIERLELAMRLLKVRRRLAQLTVLDQRDDPELGMSVSRIEFVEINDDGQPIGEAKQFDLRGDLVYVDYLRVTFDDRYVEAQDLDRSTAICLFQRIFGEHQEAVDGFQLDQVGTRPTAYARGSEMSNFEQQIWNDFWSIANDPARAAELGIHAAHGAAVSMRVRPGAKYELELRATGDITIRPLETPPPPEPAE